MSRLTEGSACFMFCAGEREELGEDCSFYEVCFERQMYDKLKHYEDLEEQGYRMVNIDKVVEQLEEVSELDDSPMYEPIEMVELEKAIEIVKGGTK